MQQQENLLIDNEVPLPKQESEKFSSLGNISIIDLDHDSLESVLSYCPNRGSYEIQSMKYVCKTWNLLLNGRLSNSLSEKESISKTIKETIRSSSLLNRIEQTYLPRLYFQIFVPMPLDDTDNDDDNVESESQYFIEFKRIFGDSVRKISDSELEIDFEMDQALLEDIEQVIDKNITIPRGEPFYEYMKINNFSPTDEEELKLYHVVRKAEDKEKKLREHLSLITLYNNWKNQPLIDKKMKVNPCRLSKKVLLHLKFHNSYGGHKIFQESTIYCTKRRKKGFMFSKNVEDEINFKSGWVIQDFQVLYKFKANKDDSFRNRSRIIVYYLLREKLIPKMDQVSIDLKSFFDRETLNYIKSLEREDQYYCLTVRENIIKKYRDGLLSGNVKFPKFTSKKFQFCVDGHIIPEFLTFAGLETMDNHQRIQFIKQFFKHIYDSGLLISDEKRQEFFDKFQIDHRKQMFTVVSDDSSSITINFERVSFKRELATIYHHVYSFSSFPSMLLNIQEVIPQDKRLFELTGAGKTDYFYTKTCCMSRIFGYCNCCLITSCWCSTCCCCYGQAPDYDIVSSTQKLGLPKWIGWFFKGVCRYEHKMFPMLDCSHCFDQCNSVWKGIDDLKERYEEMYKNLEEN